MPDNRRLYRCDSTRLKAVKTGSGGSSRHLIRMKSRETPCRFPVQSKIVLKWAFRLPQAFRSLPAVDPSAVQKHPLREARKSSAQRPPCVCSGTPPRPRAGFPFHAGRLLYALRFPVFLSHGAISPHRSAVVFPGIALPSPANRKRGFDSQVSSGILLSVDTIEIV